MRRLCDSLTNSDDDNAETSRMNDDEDEIVTVTDEDEIKMLETEVCSYGHRPLVRYTRTQVSTRPHRNLDRRRGDNCGIEEDQDTDPGRTTTIYIHVRGSFKAPPEYLSTNGVSSSNPTIAILWCVISCYVYCSG